MAGVEETKESNDDDRADSDCNLKFQDTEELDEHKDTQISTFGDSYCLICISARDKHVKPHLHGHLKGKHNGKNHQILQMQKG